MIYLDNAATSIVDPNVIDDINYYLKNKYYNPSSIYSKAADVRDDIEKARGAIAEYIGAGADEIIFTASGSAANNLAIRGFLKNYTGFKIVACSNIEHPSVLNTIRNLPDKYEFLEIPVNKDGIINIDDLPDVYSFVSIMMANNELGTINNIREIGSRVREVGGILHTDATQAFGHIDINVGAMNIDMMSVSLHKCGLPKGIGFLYKNRNIKLKPLIYGGNQENGLVAGTENTAYIYAAGKHIGRITPFSMDKINLLASELLKIDKVKLNCFDNNHLPNILSVTIPGCRADQLIALLDEYGIMVSAGSACHAGDPEPSHVLTAIGLSRYMASCTIRISIGNNTTNEDIYAFINKLKKCVNIIRSVYCQNTD